MALADWGRIQISGELTNAKYARGISDDLRKPLHWRMRVCTNSG